MNHRASSRETRGDEARDHRRVLAGRVLPGPVDVEVAKGDDGDAQGRRERARVRLPGELARRVRRLRPGQHPLVERERVLISVHGGGRRQHGSGADRASRQQDVQRAPDVHVGRQDRLDEGPGHRSLGALMEDHVARFVVDGLHALAERGDVVVGERIEQRNVREEQLVAVLVGHEKRITEGSEV